MPISPNKKIQICFVAFVYFSVSLSLAFPGLAVLHFNFLDMLYFTSILLIDTRLQEARNGLSSSSGGVGKKGTPRQLVLLLSDGRFDRENKDRLRKLVREMNERGQLLVLIGELALCSRKQ